MPDYVSTEEAAEMLGYHVKYVRKMVRTGKLPGEKKVGVWWVEREAVEEYLKSVEGMAKNDPRRKT